MQVRRITGCGRAEMGRRLVVSLHLTARGDAPSVDTRTALTGLTVAGGIAVILTPSPRRLCHGSTDRPRRVAYRIQLEFKFGGLTSGSCGGQSCRSTHLRSATEEPVPVVWTVPGTAATDCCQCRAADSQECRLSGRHTITDRGGPTATHRAPRKKWGVAARLMRRITATAPTAYYLVGLIEFCLNRRNGI